MRVLRADRDGVLGGVRAEEIGLAAGALGAGRARKGDAVDPAVGIVLRPKIGDPLDVGEPIGQIHARDEAAAAVAARRTLAALDVAVGGVPAPVLIHTWLDTPKGG